jgi:hypothetical protein
MMQTVLRYLGWDEETKRVREEAKQNITLAEQQLAQIQARLRETSRISTSGRKALSKTLSESDFGQRRAVGG